MEENDFAMHGSVPTLDDVARKAGVSTATVSRCLNLPDRVANKTRARVMDAVRELGYTPNFAARVMAAKRSFTIGAIIPTMENAIFARGLQAFQEELRNHGYTLLVASSAYSPDQEEEQIHTLVSRGVDGLLLIGFEREADIYDHLSKRKIPALVAWSSLPDAPAPSVGFDNRKAMCDLATEVFRNGHRNVAMISGILNGNDRAKLRLAGLEDAMRAEGLDPKQLRIIEKSYDIANGSDAFATLMTSGNPPSAVICGNDVLAVGALHRARAMGIHVPRDVSITGFDDIELASIVHPSLTTVHVPHREMGLTAARALVSIIEQKGAFTPIKLATRLELRGSLAPVSNR